MRSVYKFRLQAGLLVFSLQLAGCVGATYDTHDDLTISTHVKIALLDDVRVGGDRLDAATLHGVVTLSGTVSSQADADRAIAVASKVRGVKAVKSELKISSSQLQLSALRFSSPLLAPRPRLPVLGPDPIGCDAERL